MQGFYPSFYFRLSKSSFVLTIKAKPFVGFLFNPTVNGQLQLTVVLAWRRCFTTISTLHVWYFYYNLSMSSRNKWCEILIVGWDQTTNLVSNCFQGLLGGFYLAVAYPWQYLEKDNPVFTFAQVYWCSRTSHRINFIWKGPEHHELAK